MGSVEWGSVLSSSLTVNQPSRWLRTPFTMVGQSTSGRSGINSEEGGARDGQTGGRSDRVDGSGYDDKGCRAWSFGSEHEVDWNGQKWLVLKGWEDGML